MIKYIKYVKTKDPSIKKSIEVLIHPSFKTFIYYKIMHYLYNKKLYFLARLTSYRLKKKTGIEIHPGAKIGKNFFIDHGSGVVIGETTIIGNNVTIYQGVTLGNKKFATGKRHPTIEDNVIIYSSAKVLGNITIGENSIIGAGSVVLNDVNSNETVAGVPAKTIKTNTNINEILKFL